MKKNDAAGNTVEVIAENKPHNAHTTKPKPLLHNTAATKTPLYKTKASPNFGYHAVVLRAKKM